MSRLYRTKKSPLDCTEKRGLRFESGGGSEIISSDDVQNGILFPKFNFAAGRDEWVLPDKKIIPGLYIVVRLGTIFWFGSGQSPGPPEIYRLVMVSG